MPGHRTCTDTMHFTKLAWSVLFRLELEVVDADDPVLQSSRDERRFRRRRPTGGSVFGAHTPQMGTEGGLGDVQGFGGEDFRFGPKPLDQHFPFPLGQHRP